MTAAFTGDRKFKIQNQFSLKISLTVSLMMLFLGAQFHYFGSVKVFSVNTSVEVSKNKMSHYFQFPLLSAQSARQQHATNYSIFLCCLLLRECRQQHWAIERPIEQTPSPSVQRR